MNCAAERPVVTDRRRTEALNEVADVVSVIMPGIPMLAVVRSTFSLGDVGLSLLSISR
ncbi:MAG: hypothetical protein JNN07_06975 [Verrucomicrobiales bacterium]|nr:hypothetical protein [Verrucomicrobiales bacterium]